MKKLLFALALFTLQPCLAAPDPEIVRVVKHASVSNTVVRGQYAVADCSVPNGSGFALLLIQINGKWQHAIQGRPVLSGYELYTYAVPRGEWAALLGREPEAVALPEGPAWPETRSQYLQPKDLEWRNALTLGCATKSLHVTGADSRTPTCGVT